jgi:hypothetical protein
MRNRAIANQGDLLIGQEPFVARSITGNTLRANTTPQYPSMILVPVVLGYW